MNIILETDVNLDLITPAGNKNFQLLLASLGIRSQIELISIVKNKKSWQVEFELERPEYWGNDLDFMREDLDNLIITNNKKPESFKGRYKIIKKELNIQSDTAVVSSSEKAP